MSKDRDKATELPEPNFGRGKRPALDAESHYQGLDPAFKQMTPREFPKTAEGPNLLDRDVQEATMQMWRDRAVEAAKPLEERLRSAGEILGPLRDVPPSIWALVVLAERVEEAREKYQPFKSTAADALAHLEDCQQSFRVHLTQVQPQDMVATFVALGQLHRVPR